MRRLVAMVLCGKVAGWHWQPLRRLSQRSVRAATAVETPATTTTQTTQTTQEGKEDELSFGSARSVGETLRGDVRMRFAPSPTGSLHVGGARTALYNWLAAKKSGGQFVVRIEDTDLARSTRESEDSMLADLEWLGLAWDEGPRVGGPCVLYRQSERGSVYAEAAETLVEQGKAYPCFCSEEELEEKRQRAKAEGRQVAYDGTWRDADPAEVSRRLDAGDPHTIRFRAPKDCVLKIDDVIRGRIAWDVESTIGDFILVRSTGVPVYNFVVAVDDATMGISTVVRAEEHLTNTVRQLLVLDALGFPEPLYAHASLILGSDKSKLSKRHGATSCGQFKREGYLADAMINYLALLGWNDGTDKELYARDELVQAFDLNRVVASPAMFDPAKLRWLNGQHLRAMDTAQLADLAVDFFKAADIDLVDHEDIVERFFDDDQASVDVKAFVAAATAMAQPKAELLTDVASVVRESLAYPLSKTLESTADEKKLRTVLDDDFRTFAAAVVDSYADREAPAWCYEEEEEGSDAPVDEAEVKAWIGVLGEKTGRSKKRLFMAARLALTGRLAGPDIPAQLKTLALARAAHVSSPDLVPIPDRLDALRHWVSSGAEDSSSSTDDGAVSSSSSSDATTTTTTASATHQEPLTFDEFRKLRAVYETNRRELDDDQAMYDALLAAYKKLRP